MINLPIEFEKRMREQLCDEYPAFIASYDEPSKHGLRVNTLRMSCEDFLGIAPPEWDLRPTELCREGFILSESGTKNAGKHPYHAAGAYYLQEPSAMSVAAALSDYPFSDETRVLDMCAAPGGKTGAVAAYMRGHGVLIANEIVQSRAQELAKNVERLGITNCAVANTSPDIIADALPGYFDIVIVDAPCSGEGMFRKNPLACREWSPEHVQSCAVRQRNILKSAARCVKCGGLIVYSTCTFSREENEDTIWYFCREEGFSAVSMRRLYPHTSDGEGHFVCVMRHDSGSSSVSHSKKEKNAPKPVYLPCNSQSFRDFMSETFTAPPQVAAYISDGGRVILSDERLIHAVQKLKCISCGVEAGYDKGRYFDPSHTLFAAAYDCTYRLCADYPADSDEAMRFMRGEELISPFPDCESGYCRICADSLPLGFCKVTGGMMKNKLPKGLRRQK